MAYTVVARKWQQVLTAVLVVEGGFRTDVLNGLFLKLCALTGAENADAVEVE